MKPTDEMDWLKRGLIEMQTRELKERNNVRTRRMKESVLADATDREELQCVFCNCYSYLSFIGCECTDKVSCLDHSAEVCIYISVFFKKWDFLNHFKIVVYM